MKVYIGLDTSCYTTSVAIMDAEGRLRADTRRLLSVKPGGRGLAQSEMVFQHTRHLPDLFAEAIGALQADKYEIAGIGVSVRPRPVADSYMPAFLVGHGYARTVGAILGIPVSSISHQENHIYAGIWSSGGPISEEFLALHLSGGTTEIVEVRALHAQPVFHLLGGSLDLHAGQFVDRVGVSMGLPFPAGPALEKLAATWQKEPVSLHSSLQGLSVSFSGPESQAQRLLQAGSDAAAIAAGVQECISRSIVRMIVAGAQKTRLADVLLAGGVTANQSIRRYICDHLTSHAVKVYCPDPAYSSDNAVGAAFYALRVAATPVSA